VNVAFPRRDRITHEARQTNANGGTTWCGITFYWYPMDPYAVLVPETAECDCMACIARPEAMIEFNCYLKPGISVINKGAIARLEFLIDDKEPT
jgi:hypothetical protein